MERNVAAADAEQTNYYIIIVVDNVVVIPHLHN